MKEKYYDCSNFMIDENTVFEDAFYDNEHQCPIFVILMHSGTVLANAIKQVTQAEFSHACISFNSQLDPMYSFGGKTRESGFGFVVQDPKDDFYKNHHAKYSIYVMFVSKAARDAMKKRLQYFQKNNSKLKYDILGLIQVFFNQRTDYKNDKFFCSRFVADIISAGGVELKKNASLWKPEDLKQLSNISLVQSGNNFYNYSKYKVEKEIEKIKKNNNNSVTLAEDGKILCEKLIDKYKYAHPGINRVLKEDKSFICKSDRDISNMKSLLEFCNKTLDTLGYENKLISSPINLDIEGKIQII